MSILRKLFGESSKKTSASNAGKWDATLSKCDLLMARDEIVNLHKMISAKGEKEGGAYYFKKEYVAAWESFRDKPTIDTSRTLLEAAPPLLQYFEMCSPGSDFYLTYRFLKEQGL